MITPRTVGIVGAGGIATELHLPVLRSIPGVAIAWIADRNRARARSLAAAVGAKSLAVSTAHELPYADVVLLAIPYGARRGMYEPLSESGCALYVEKPFALTAEEHDMHCGLFADERLACGLLFRSLGSTRALRDIVRSRLFGPLQAIRIEFGHPKTRSGTYQHSLGAAGGGALFDVAIHVLDAAVYIAEIAAIQVESVRMLYESGFDVHTTAKGRALQKDGDEVAVEVLVSNLCFTNMTNTYKFESATVRHAIFGERTLLVEDGRNRNFVIAGSAGQGPSTSAQALAVHWLEFLHGLDEAKPNYTSARSTRVTSQFIADLYAVGS